MVESQSIFGSGNNMTFSKDKFGVQEPSTKEKMDEMLEKIRKLEFEATHYKELYALEKENADFEMKSEISNLLESHSTPTFDGQNNRAKFKENFTFVYHTSLFKKRKNVFNTALVRACVGYAQKPALEIATNRFEKDPMENLDHLMNETLLPDGELLAISKLSAFKFTLKNFEKEVDEFLELLANFPVGICSEHFLALLMYNALPPTVKIKLIYDKISTVNEVAKKVNSIILFNPSIVHGASSSQDNWFQVKKESN